MERLENDKPGEISFASGKTILEEIIEQAFRLLCFKLGRGGITAHNEISFQCELGILLKTLGQLYEFKQSDKFLIDFETSITLAEKSVKSKSKKARIDMLIKYKLNNKVTTAAIELKFFKKENHREPNNRYDVFKDISNLEKYKKEHADLCYFILVTDHRHYVHQLEYSKDTSDFDIRLGKGYLAGTRLSYRTKKPYGPDIILSNDYYFSWRSVENLYFLKLKI